MGSCAEREKPVNVLIVGCGNIAGRFDMSNKSANYAQTHAGAYFKNKKFSITACIEPDQYRREEFMAYWKIDNGYPSFSKAIFSAAKFDVISICSPTDQHESDILSAIDLNPQIIFCEKPIAPTLKSSKAVALACEKAGIPLAVNYSRRWDMQLRDFLSQLDKGDYGKLRSVVGLYNKGILNNGSHLIDLLQLLLGDLSICSIGQKTNDYLEGDPSISAVLTTKSGISVHLVTGHSSDYSLFEVQFIFENSIITMLDGGARWQVRSRKESDVYSGYFALSIGESKIGGYAMAMENSIDNIHSFLSDGSEILSTAENSLVAQNLCESLCKAEA
jgi:predicted dehydrogenase